jgi:hypothetical protein
MAQAAPLCVYNMWRRPLQPRRSPAAGRRLQQAGPPSHRLSGCHRPSVTAPAAPPPSPPPPLTASSLCDGVQVRGQAGEPRAQRSCIISLPHTRDHLDCRCGRRGVRMVPACRPDGHRVHSTRLQSWVLDICKAFARYRGARQGLASGARQNSRAASADTQNACRNKIGLHARGSLGGSPLSRRCEACCGDAGAATGWAAIAAAAALSSRGTAGSAARKIEPKDDCKQGRWNVETTGQGNGQRCRCQIRMTCHKAASCCGHNRCDRHARAHMACKQAASRYTRHQSAATVLNVEQLARTMLPAHTRTCTVSSSCCCCCCCCCGGGGSGAYGNASAIASACTAAAGPAAAGSPPCSAAESAEMRSSCASDSSEPKGLGLGSAAAGFSGAGFTAAGFSAWPACCWRRARCCSAAAAWGAGSGTRCRGGLAGLASKGQPPAPSSDDRFRCGGSCRCNVKGVSRRYVAEGGRSQTYAPAVSEA